jgi:hypothetical protein
MHSVVYLLDEYKRISDRKITSVLSFVTPYIFNLCCKVVMFEEFKELQLIQDTSKLNFGTVILGLPSILLFTIMLTKTTIKDILHRLILAHE